MAIVLEMTNKLQTVAFKIGTCEGIYNVSNDAYQIIAVQNNELNNGHFTDVLEWFEFAAKRDGKALRFLAILNDKFGKHLVSKRGFKWEGQNVAKYFR